MAGRFNGSPPPPLLIPLVPTVPWTLLVIACTDVDLRPEQNTDEVPEQAIPTLTDRLMAIPLYLSRLPTVPWTLLVIACANTDLRPERNDKGKVPPEQAIPTLTAKYFIITSELIS